MNVASEIRELLLTFTPLTALVQQRVYRLNFPQSVTLPAVRVQQIDDLETPHLRGPVDLIRARVQVDAVALTGAAAVAVADAVHGDGVSGVGLRMFRGDSGASPSLRLPLIRPITVREDTTDIAGVLQFRVMRDYFVYYKPM